MSTEECVGLRIVDRWTVEWRSYKTIERTIGRDTIRIAKDV